jgi:ribosomal protein S18 acetylase RimI-like enzyme
MHSLDNVIWQALTTKQVQFAEARGQARRFMPEVTALTGLGDENPQNFASLGELIGPRGTGALFLDHPYEDRDGWEYVVGAPLLQMVCDSRTVHQNTNFEIVELGLQNSPEMIELTMLTKPGPFGPRTHELGTYLGIRREGKLVAMAGERLKVPGYTEVSAVCTHPDHLGNGYAQALMSAVMRGIRERGETPFLHVRGDNTRAVKVYEKLGFKTRKRGYFAEIRKV